MTPDLRRLVRWSVALCLCAVAVCVINAATGNGAAGAIVGVAGCAVICLTARGFDALDGIEAADDYEAVHVMESYRPLGLAEEWGYNDEDGAA